MKRWMELSLRGKLSFIMLVTTVIPLIVLGGFAYVVSSRITEEKAKQSGIDTLRQMEANLRFMIKDVESMSIFLIGQRDIQDYVRSREDDVVARTRILVLMANLGSSKDYISNITIYPKGPLPPLSTMTIYESDLERKVDIPSVTAKMWTDLYSVRTYNGDRNVLSFIRPLRSVDNYETIGWISISLDEKVVSRYWTNPNLGGGHGSVALVNERGSILSSNERLWLSLPLESVFPHLFGTLDPGGGAEAGAVVYGEGRDKKTVLYVTEPLLGWRLTGIIPFEQYSAQNRYILQLTAAAVALSVIATAALILFFVRQVTNPLRALTRLLSKVNPEEPMPLYPAAASDEIGKLAASYNMLGKHIEKLKQELIKGEARKKEADMRALQAQINPHFLYNTLSSIHWIALMNEEKRIADMVGALSDFLRFSLNKGKEFCPVQQELDHIRNYVQVQSIRFPDKFDVDITVDPELLDKFMLKLLLQPLVENAMIHGVQKKEGKGTITVYVERKSSYMNFLVLDDGVGMSEEQLALVRSAIRSEDGDRSSDSSYGLRNVHERLQLHYGADAGLHIESRLHLGTKVSFTIPILEEQHENHDRG